MRLKNKVAIVTGGGSGFGEGIAQRFAEEGAAVIIGDINIDAAGRVAAAISKHGNRAIAVQCDVSRATDFGKLVSTAEDKFAGLDIVINNAGVPQRNGSMLDVDEVTFDRIFSVNVKSLYWSAIHAVPALKRRGGGVIINTASTAGVRPRPGLVWYNGSKGAAITITKSMAVELAPHRIRVCAINPVAGETPMLAEFMGGADTPEVRSRFLATIPLGRMSQPRDIANAALYLASDDADFITGVCLEVDGGRCV
jgi:3-oxoacyl-[acyl-carrier protein] reductase